MPHTVYRLHDEASGTVLLTDQSGRAAQWSKAGYRVTAITESN